MLNNSLIFVSTVDDPEVYAYLSECSTHIVNVVALCGYQLDSLYFENDFHVEVHQGDTRRKAVISSDDAFTNDLWQFSQFLLDSDPVRDSQPFGSIRKEVQEIMTACDYYGEEMGRIFFIQEDVVASYLCIDQWEIWKDGQSFAFDGSFGGSFPEAWKAALSL